MIQRRLEIEISSIEAQLKVIKAGIKSMKGEEIKKKASKAKFADLYGIWKGKVDISYDEIKKAEFKVPEGILK